jgi:predicted P-loop ATPase
MAGKGKGGSSVVTFPGAPPAEWKKGLAVTRDGETKATLHNLQLILERDAELAGMFGLDEFANRVVIKRAPPWKSATAGEFTEIDGTELAAWLGAPATYGINAKSTLVLEAVECVARRYRFHPVRDYLRGLAWDGTPRLDALFASYFGALAGDYATKVARIFLIGAVARVRAPGCKNDTMLVLEGAQGAGKTRVTRTLFGGDWYAEAMESPASKDFYQSLQGRWGVEIGEMESFSKAEVNKVKQAISAQDDTFRPSYGRYARKFPRQCVFIGTTNDDHYLRDHTGGRRFLPIKVAGSIDVDAVARDRDQLWAEAFHLYSTGATWHELPAEAREQQEARFMEDSWADPVRRWLAGEAGEKMYHQVDTEPGGRVRVCTTTHVLWYALQMETARHGKPEQMRVAQIMKRHGFTGDRILRNGERVRVWVREGVQVDTLPPAPPAPPPAQQAPQGYDDDVQAFDAHDPPVEDNDREAPF